MRQHISSTTLTRRTTFRPSPLFNAASTCLLVFVAALWSFKPGTIETVPRMVSAATPYMSPGAYVTAAPHPTATTVVSHTRENTAPVRVALQRSAATKPLGVYHNHGSSGALPPFVGPSTLYCSPGFVVDTPVLSTVSRSVPAAPTASVETQPVTLGGKHATAVNLTSIPECSVRTLPAVAASVGRPSNNVVVMARTPPSTIEASTPARRPGIHEGPYLVGAPRTSVPTARATIQQQPPRATRTHKTLCLRRTWPATHVREPGAHGYEPICAPISTLHTYDPVAPPVSAAASASMHAHGPALRTVIPRYDVVGTPVHSRTFPLHEGYSRPEKESGGATEDWPRGSSATGAHETLSWPRASHMFSTGAQLLPGRTGTAKDASCGERLIIYLSECVRIEMYQPHAKGGRPADLVVCFHSCTHLALLQMEIDAFCRKRFEALCSSQGGRFCTNSPVVGRYGPGGRNDVGGWKCYNRDEMSMSTRSVGCVDQCGNLMRCLGATDPNTTSIPVPELDEWVLQRKWQHCSAYQQAADALCNFKTSGDLARYDLHRKRWMCLDLDDIAFEGTSYCVDNCGGPIPCVGGLVSGESDFVTCRGIQRSNFGSGVVPKFTVHIVQHPDMERAFEAIQPCPDLNDVCIATVLNPPRCVKQSTTVLVQRLSGQQERMDEECQENRDDACRRGTLQEECFRLWLARYDIGTEPGSRPAWRCYPESALDFTQISRCADGCGNLVPCRGAPLTPTPLAVNVPKAGETINDPSYCSAYQRAGNSYCRHKYGSGFVARQHCKSLKWQCLNKDRLPSQGWIGCIGHCGEATTCPVGVDDMVEIPDVDDLELVHAFKSVPNPCPPGEVCEPVKQAPPYCSVSRPRPSSMQKDNE